MARTGTDSAGGERFRKSEGVSEKSVFLEALELEDPLARERFLSRACGSDAGLRQAVDRLLRAHHSPDNPLDRPVSESGWEFGLEGLRSGTAPESGSMIGPYKLKELIGEGGFGLVYVAEQQHPVRRLVALKIIKPGMDSKDVIARFEAERQALAMMAHPNIAQVLDAGISADHRLYFVMELVRGVALTEFCDRQRMLPGQRIGLLIDVCSAVQHAHQKGVIHRDIKPSNVMVTLYDDRPVVKVIDFGIAKAIGQRLTDRTIYTRFFAMIGTPAYMSPEQAQMSALDVDTRSDIYSLGVLLYELLTGSTPFERERLDSVGYDEMRHIIAEEEPMKPSQRLTTMGNRLETASAMRGMEGSRLSSYVAGDLDWIVLKALEKDRNRRYVSAAAMGEDLKRFLNQEPIEARPPSRLYQFRKFCRRNRVALATTIAVLSALLTGTGVSVWQATNAIAERNAKEIALADAVRARDEARVAKREIELFAESLKDANELLTSGQSYVERQQWANAHREFSEAIEVQPNYYLVWIQRAQLYARLKCWSQAADDFSRAIELGAPVDEPSMWGAAPIFAIEGRIVDYQAVVRKLIGVDEEPRDVSWNSIRSAVMMEEAGIDFGWLARISERKLAMPRGDRFDRERSDPLSMFRPAPGRPRGDPRRNERRNDFLPIGVQFYVAGLAQLRAGDHAKALEFFSEAMRADRGWPGAGMLHAAMAITHYRLGDKEAAATELSLSGRMLDNWERADERAVPNSPPLMWSELVELQVMHREASLLIDGKTDGREVRFQALQQKALDEIGVNW